MKQLINSDEEPNGEKRNDRYLINFNKIRKIGKVLLYVKSCQDGLYNFQPNFDLIKLLINNTQYISDDDCWIRSQAIEPS